MSNNNVKVNVKFTCDKDDNLDLYSMKANISYYLPEEIGFKKSKQFEVALIEDTTLVGWVKASKYLMVGQRIKGVIYNEVKEHIMERLRKAYDNDTDAISNILNMFNQMKFDFHFDVSEAEKIVVSEKQAFSSEPLTCV